MATIGMLVAESQLSQPRYTLCNSFDQNKIFTGPGLAEMSHKNRYDPTPCMIDSPMPGKLGCQQLRIGTRYGAMRSSLSTCKAQMTSSGDPRDFEESEEHTALRIPHTFGRQIATLRSHRSSLCLDGDSESNNWNVCEAES